jgi:hypothetical protein
MACGLYKISNNSDIGGWSEFKSGAIDNYPFIQDVNIDSTIPIQINIIYNLNRIPDTEEIDKIFEYTMIYLNSDQNMQGLVNYHKKKYDNSFSRIKIILHLWQKDETYDIEIFSFQRGKGEPKLSYFSDWNIEYNHEQSERYKTVTY